MLVSPKAYFMQRLPGQPKITIWSRVSLRKMGFKNVGDFEEDGVHGQKLVSPQHGQLTVYENGNVLTLTIMRKSSQYGKMGKKERLQLSQSLAVSDSNPFALLTM